MMITNNFDRMAIWQTKPMYWEPKLALFSVSQTLKKRCCFSRITVFTINVSSVYTQQGTEDFLRTFWNKATEYLILLSYGVFYSDLWCLIEPLDLKNVYHYRAVMCFRESCGSDSLSILVPWVISKMTSFFFYLEHRTYKISFCLYTYILPQLCFELVKITQFLNTSDL